MSEAMKCDRCGKYVDGNDIPTIRGWRTETARRVGSPMLKMDLCDECYKALEDFLVNKGCGITVDKDSVTITGL